MSNKPILILIITVLILGKTLQQSHAVSSAQNWEYFPINTQGRTPSPGHHNLEQLALISRGPNKTYTPGVYQIVPNQGQNYIDIQIWDAPTHEESQNLDVDYVRNGVQEMLIDIPNTAYLRCLDKNGIESLINGKDKIRRLSPHSNSCKGVPIFHKNRVDKDGWSSTIRVYKKPDKILRLRTFWAKAAAPERIISNTPNTFNIFSFRTRNGRILLSATEIKNINTINIKNFPQINETTLGQAYKSYRNKIYYDPYINWTTPYTLDLDASFAFDLYIKDLDELILFDKDADASTLHGPSSPADPGIQMKVSWKNDHTLKNAALLTNWSHFDQTKRNNRKIMASDPDYYPFGEYASFSGPSWDLNRDLLGRKSIQWYAFKIPQNRPSDWVRVEWSNSQSETNFFGFASNAPMYSSGKTTVPSTPCPKGQSLQDKICKTDATTGLEACSNNPFLTLEIKELTRFNDQETIDDSQWKTDHPTSKDAHQLRVYGFKAGANIMPSSNTKTNLPLIKEKNQYYVSLADYRKISIPFKDIQNNLLRNVSKIEDHYVKGSRKLMDAEKDLPGIIITRNIGKVEIPEKLRKSLQRSGKNIQYINNKGQLQGFVDYIGLQILGRGTEKLKSFYDIRVGFPCAKKGRTDFGFHDVSEQSFESRGKSNSVPSSCDYRDGDADKNLRRFRDDLWEKKISTDAYQGCGGDFKDSQITKTDRTSDDLKNDTVQILQTLTTNTETTIISYGCIRGTEGDGECKENMAPKKYILELHASPVNGSTVLSTEEIKYTLRLKNTGKQTLHNVKMHLEAPVLTTEKADQLKDYDLGDLKTQTKSGVFTDKNYSVTVDKGLVNQTISSQGKFYFTADEYGDEKKYANLVCHFLGTGDPETGRSCTCNGEGCDVRIDPQNPIIKCTESGNMRACIESDPENGKKGLNPLDNKLNWITYKILVQNLSKTEDTPIPLNNLVLNFENPLRTTLQSEQIPEITPAPGTGIYTGKGKGSFQITDTLLPNQSISKNVTVIIDASSQETDFDISSKDKLWVDATNNAEIILPEQIHHVGNGAVDISIKRCYAYNYRGGDFECSTSCDAIEPDTEIIVRDTIINKGGKSKTGYTYTPLPLADSLDYVKESLYIGGPGGGKGMHVENDGDTFPPAGGVQIPGIIRASGGIETVFFRYRVPENLSGCRPLEGKEPSPANDQGPFADVEYETDCGDKNGKVCVEVKINPVLTGTLTALPTEDKEVYQGSVIEYFLRIKNSTKQPVTSLKISAADVALAECHNSNCAEQTETNPADLSGTFGTFTKTYRMKVKKNARGNKVINPGQTITYNGKSGEVFKITTNAVEHELLAESEPVGVFTHDINLTRRTVLNSSDGTTARSKINSQGGSLDHGDETTLEHKFEYKGTGKEVHPFLTSGQKLPTGYRFDYCSREVGRGYRGPEQLYEAPPKSRVRVYQSQIGNSPQLSYTGIKSDDISFTITTNLPQERPKFVTTISGVNPDIIQYTVSGKGFLEDGINPVNYLMKKGGKLSKNSSYTLRSPTGQIISANRLRETKARAILDGRGGRMITKNQSELIREDSWSYLESGRRKNKVTCKKKCGKFTCRSDYYPPEFKWFFNGSDNTFTLTATDSDYITALTSVAWLKTTNGHLGIGTPFWTSDPKPGDPNSVDLGDSVVNSQMKFYTPPGEYNADMLIYTPGLDNPLKTRLNGASKIDSTGMNLGYIPDKLNGEGIITLPHGHQLSRGDAYDREKFPRDYFDDMLNRQIYGKVLRLHEDKSLLSGLTGSKGNYNLKGTATFKIDHIYYLKGNLSIGNPSAPGESDFIIAGAKARLFVDGSVTIYDNIYYSSHKNSDPAKIPSLRLHTTGNVYINPAVTDIELMILAENEFHSGKGDEQLRILGDVITYRVFWERRPLNKKRNPGEEVNRPSEIIYEDYRKYIITPPGDKKLPDVGYMWHEVDPSTGRPLLQDLWK